MDSDYNSATKLAVGEALYAAEYDNEYGLQQVDSDKFLTHLHSRGYRVTHTPT